MAQRKTVIFIPGGWHSPNCFEGVATLLNRAGYQTDSVKLPSVGPEKSRSGVDADTARIRSYVAPAVEAGQDVVLVMHSYGAVPAQDAVHGLDLGSRFAEGKSGGVCHLFFCSALIIDAGQSVLSASGGQMAPWYRLEGDVTIPITPEQTFYNDLDEVGARTAAAKLKPHSVETGKGVVRYAAWKHIPSTYLHCLRDQALPLEAQKAMVEQIAGAGVHFKIETLDSGHSPFFSMPEELAFLIRRAAGEDI